MTRNQGTQRKPEPQAHRRRGPHRRRLLVLVGLVIATLTVAAVVMLLRPPPHAAVGPWAVGDGGASHPDAGKPLGTDSEDAAVNVGESDTNTTAPPRTARTDMVSRLTSPGAGPQSAAPEAPPDRTPAPLPEALNANPDSVRYRPLSSVPPASASPAPPEGLPEPGVSPAEERQQKIKMVFSLEEAIRGAQQQLASGSLSANERAKLQAMLHEEQQRLAEVAQWIREHRVSDAEMALARQELEQLRQRTATEPPPPRR